MFSFVCQVYSRDLTCLHEDLLANDKDIPNRDDSKIFQTEGGKYWPQGRCGKKAGSPFKPWIFRM